LARIKSYAVKVLDIALSCDFEEQFVVTNLSEIQTLTTDLWRNYLISSQKKIVFVGTQENFILQNEFLQEFILIDCYFPLLSDYL
jgi:hypothetical protein